MYCVPVWEAIRAPQMLEMVEVIVKFSDQSTTSRGPRFVTVICPVNPEPQSLLFWKVTSTCAGADVAAQRQSAAIRRRGDFIVRESLATGTAKSGPTR